WFQEWGCLSLVGAAGVVLWNDMARGYRYSLTFAEEQRQMQRQLDMQKEHYRQISNQIKESRRMRHDFRQHLRVILSMSERNEKVCKYIHEITSIGALIAPTSFCENHAVDALIRYYATVSKFENAIEASGRLIDKEKKITVKGKLDTSAFYFVVQNNFDNIVIKKDNKFISRKHNGFGIGFESIKEVVKRHNGMLEVESEHGVFKASVVLPYYE
ncbi:MAG: GHKL domain-containing protein, partial [Oscillospiraceae bacterium]